MNLLLVARSASSASIFWSKVINSPLPGDKIWFLIGGLPMGVGAVLLAWIALRGHEPQTRAAARSGCGTGAWFVLVIILGSFFVPVVLPDWGQAPLLALELPLFRGQFLV